jgi:hypothetical protein
MTQMGQNTLTTMYAPDAAYDQRNFVETGRGHAVRRRG